MAKRNTSHNPVLDVARYQRQLDETIITLADGRRGKVVPVTASLLEQVSSKILDPDPPMVKIDRGDGREYSEENPNDPKYLRDLTKIGRKRGSTAVGAMVMFGLELPDGLPQDDGWLKRLRQMQRLGLLEFADVDLDDPLDQEFLYKRLIAADAFVVNAIGEVSGLTPEDIEEAEASFQGN